MKTAILFTGFVRSYSIFGEQLHVNLLKAFSNADLYFCLWDVIDLTNSNKVNLDPILKICKSMKVLNWNYHKDLVKKTIKLDRQNDIYNINKFAISQGVEASNRIKNQWYLVRQGMDLIADNYDIVVRSRLDLNYTNVLLPNKIENGITIPYNFFSNHYAKNVDI